MARERVRAGLKRQVAARARGRCEYCRCPVGYSPHPFSIEHVIPRDKAGATVLENLAFACDGCNGHKHTKTEAEDPDTGHFVSLYHPRCLKWEEHFAWSADCLVVVGLTPIGRATVQALQMNREGVVNLRRLLCGVGEHPPPEAE